MRRASIDGWMAAFGAAVVVPPLRACLSQFGPNAGGSHGAVVGRLIDALEAFAAGRSWLAPAG